MVTLKLSQISLCSLGREYTTIGYYQAGSYRRCSTMNRIAWNKKELLACNGKYFIWNMIYSLGWNSLWICDAKTKRKNVFWLWHILSPAFLLSVIMYTGIHQKLKYTWMSTLATLGEYRMMARHVLTILALRNIKKIINGNVLKVQYFQNSWSKSETNEQEAQRLGALLDKLEDNDHIILDNIEI